MPFSPDFENKCKKAETEAMLLHFCLFNNRINLEKIHSAPACGSYPACFHSLFSEKETQS
jgi:hypothetical protein